MAKELGFNPRTLIKNIPSKSQPWKLSVREGICHLYARRFGEVAGNAGIAAPPAVECSDALEAGASDPYEGLLPQWDTNLQEPYYTDLWGNRVDPEQ